MLRWVVIITVVLACVPLAQAEETAGQPSGKKAPPAKNAKNKRAAKSLNLEPTVTIIQGDQDTFQEFRLNGQLYMIKIVPRHGPPYFLVDTDGDGSLEARRSGLDPDFLIPQWTLFRWK